MDMRLLWPQAQRAQADSALAMCSDARAAHTLATAATTWRHARKDGTLMDMGGIRRRHRFRRSPGLADTGP